MFPRPIFDAVNSEQRHGYAAFSGDRPLVFGETIRSGDKEVAEVPSLHRGWRACERFSGSPATPTMSRKQQVLELCDKVQRDLKLAGLPIDGCATDGTEHSSIKSMWSLELGFLPTAVSLRVRYRTVMTEAG